MLLRKAVYRFSAVPIKSPVAFLTVEKKLLKCIWNHRRPRIAKENLRKESKASGTTLPDFKLYYKASHQNTGTGLKTDKSMELNWAQK